jgi:hypothetical protein
MPRVTSVDRLNDGLVITFSDNRSAFYPADFLYRRIGEVRELHEEAFPSGECHVPEWGTARLGDGLPDTGSSWPRS